MLQALRLDYCPLRPSEDGSLSWSCGFAHHLDIDSGPKLPTQRQERPDACGGDCEEKERRWDAGFPCDRSTGLRCFALRAFPAARNEWRGRGFGLADDDCNFLTKFCLLVILIETADGEERACVCGETVNAQRVCRWYDALPLDVLARDRAVIEVIADEIG